jgi:hypothetical protein
MTAWVEHYYNWLTTNPLALDEGKATNNHGTFYDAQVVALALYLGKNNDAKKLLLQDRDHRIAQQIEPDGRQPRELSRTLSFDYSTFNLRALSDLASLGQSAGVDLWHFETVDGRSLRKALKYMAASADPAKAWPHQQIHPPNRHDLYELLLRASGVYRDQELSEALKFYPAEEAERNQIRLLYPTN